AAPFLPRRNRLPALSRALSRPARAQMSGARYRLRAEGVGRDRRLCDSSRHVARTSPGGQPVRSGAWPLLRAEDPSVFRQLKKRIVRDLPHVSVGVGKMTGITTPEYRLRRLQQMAPGTLSFRQHRIDDGWTRAIPGQRGAAKRRRPWRRRDLGIPSQELPGVKRKNGSASCEERDPLDAPARLAHETKRFVETSRTREVVDPESHDGQTRQISAHAALFGSLRNPHVVIPGSPLRGAPE